MLLERIPVRFRLSIVHTAWISVFFLIIGYGLFKVVEHTLLHSVDAALLSSAQSVRDVSKLVDHEEGVIEGILREGGRFGSFVVPERLIRPYAQIINLTSQDLPHSEHQDLKLPITPKTMNRAKQGLHSLETFTFKDRPPLRQVSLPVLHNGEFTGHLVQVGASLGPTLGILKGTMVLLWLLLPLILLISVILGYILTAQALKPVGVMSQTVSKLGVGDLSIRLAVPLAEDELQELSLTFNKMLDRIEDAITRLRRFTADVSHELRTPLAVLRAEAELSLRKERNSEDYKNSLNSVHKEAKHMTVIVEDLLLLARAETSNIALTWETVKTQNFVDELLESVQPIFKSRNIDIDIDIEGSEEFSCSKTYLSLALKNILLNACKHSGIHSTVQFHIFGNEDCIHFKIKDEGEGIPENDLPYIFDPFYRSDTARNRASGGVGIGLSLTLALIKLHKGEIDVTSKLGEGTCFLAKIPLGSV